MIVEITESKQFISEKNVLLNFNSFFHTNTELCKFKLSCNSSNFSNGGISLLPRLNLLLCMLQAEQTEIVEGSVHSCASFKKTNTSLI